MGILGALGIISGFLSLGFGLTKYFKDQEDEQKQLDLAKDNLSLNEKVAQQNYDLSKDQFNYQKDLNQTVMDREDNAMQRQIADLKAAGLSPLAATNGANATPLNSANAPQHDMSGINTAISNVLGAYNDIFNRRLNRQQFALQSQVQAAQAYTQLAELKIQRKTAEKQNKLLDLDYTYYLNHPERNLGLQSMLGNLVSRVIGQNGSSVIPSPEQLKGSLNLDLTDLKNTLTGSGTILQGNLNPSRTAVLATPKQIKSDTKTIETQEKRDLQNARDMLQNYTGKDYQEKSLNYFYYHTNAWRDYETIESFKNALLKAKKKTDILSKYPYIEREPLKLGL